METIPGVFHRSSCPIFVSVELSVIEDQIRIYVWQHNYVLFLCYLPVPLPLAHQNGSGKAQTVTRLLLFRGKSSEPSFPSFCVYVISVTHDCSTPTGRRLHPAILDCSGSDTPLLHFEIVYFFKWGWLSHILILSGNGWHSRPFQDEKSCYSSVAETNVIQEIVLLTTCKVD